MDGGSRAYYCRSKTRLLCQTGRVDATVLTRFLHRERRRAFPSGASDEQAMSKDPLSPHTPSPLPADADATVTGTDMIYLAGLQPQPVEWLWQHGLAAGTLAMLSGEPGSGKTGSPSPHCAAPNSISAFVAPKTENQVPGGGLCPLRRMSALRSTRQDAQINYLSTLSIFMKQRTYLATLPNPNLKANECPCF
jgi:hypothetical protein